MIHKVVLVALLLAPAARADTVAGEIRQLVGRLEASPTPRIGSARICVASGVKSFYAQRGFQPAWPPSEVGDMLTIIEHVVEDGLRPDDYHLEQIKARLSDRKRAAELDVLLTDAFLFLATHLSGGKIDPRTVEPTWCLEGPRLDLAGALEAAVANGDPQTALTGVTSHPPGYRRLKQALAAYRQIAQSGGWEAVAAGATLRRGDQGVRVRQLSKRLAITRDLAAPAMSDFFDDQVEGAVRQFQHRHGLAADGIVGRATLRALNVPVERRIESMVLSLERWRWLPPSLGDRYALINIAAFSLEVLEKECAVLSMRIVVGKDQQRTPIFSSRITEVVFSPYWNVPESIAVTELLPFERRHPGYLADQRIEILPNGRLRQKPGPWNALGGVKFVIPNAYRVFLHDTPARVLFERSQRAFSHGCIRLEKAIELAAYLLRENPAWTPPRIVEAAEAGVEKSISLSNPLPVHMLYWTAWVDADGAMQFRDDIYGRDRALAAAMFARQRP